jgi:hypothetical protein
LALRLLVRDQSMNGKTALVGLFRVLTINLALSASSPSLAGAEVTITQTNRVERWITNVINIQMPENRFVEEYHTNWVTQMRTNIVDLYATNWTMVNLTNEVEVAGTWTNYVTVYHTNWNTRILTNHTTLNLARTNSVDQYQTNWSTLTLTNWETVVLFKTNWIAQPLTHVVQVDLASQPAAAATAPTEVVEPREATAEAASPVPAVWAGPLALEAARTSSPPANGLFEVQLKVRRIGNTAAPVQVQNWRVERDDSAVLLFGQDQQFKRPLPVGKYKVEAKLKAEGDDSPLSVRGTLSVTLRDATIQPRLLVKK